ncbi:DUF3239 domain-containing protein [Salmonella enterica]|nr:DUF3239 domain-containing protein [Salmonella enterica]EMA6046046.1 DUF3239 domain-containing protein [Salmonella enterica]EMA6050414.1 DUF3239 domain-containing protein [Salmonella enterica]
MVILFLIVTTPLAALLSAWLFTSPTTWVLILGGLLTITSIVLFVLLIMSIKKMGKPQTFFKRGVLNPGIICHVTEEYVGILVLAEITQNKTAWGLISLQAKKLLGHNLRAGERVPVTCCFGPGVNDEAFGIGYALPISWGTNDKSVIQYGVDNIPEEEWKILDKVKRRYKDLDRDSYPLASSIPQRLERLSDKEIIELGLDTLYES